MTHILDRFVGREVPWDKTSPERIKEHQEVTQGVIRFRFPPEPNGYLHLGHAKSMRLNFGIVDELRKEGKLASCYLRFDDTNPEKESTEYTQKIIETIEWLGWKPDKITYSSDYFTELYQYAIQLIKLGLAYIDYSTSEQIAEQRKLKSPSPYRDALDVNATLDRFEKMALGDSSENGVLRLKMDITSDNPNLWDPVAYRIKSMSHHRTGDQWKIYPSYDFSHCLVDSLEHIDYSLCTLEFETRREPYYWILDKLNLYKPRVWEFSRLNMERSTLSKRDINSYINKGLVESWSDPRLLTILGMRRRGFSPESINQFCSLVGLTRNENELQFALIDNLLRELLNSSAPRRFACLDPIEVEIINWIEPKTFIAKNHPSRPELGTREFVLDGPIIYIERSDFRLTDSKDFYGLAPTLPEKQNKVVGLKYGPNLIYESHQIDESGKVQKLYCRVDYEKSVKPKTHIHWIVKGHDKQVEMVLLNPLLNEKGEIDQNSRTLYSTSRVEESLNIVDDFQVYQFERLGYFIIDREYPGRYLRTIALKSYF